MNGKSGFTYETKTTRTWENDDFDTFTFYNICFNGKKITPVQDYDASVEDINKIVKSLNEGECSIKFIGSLYSPTLEINNNKIYGRYKSSRDEHIKFWETLKTLCEKVKK